jgi:hypothetical protein
VSSDVAKSTIAFARWFRSVGSGFRFAMPRAYAAALSVGLQRPQDPVDGLADELDRVARPPVAPAWRLAPVVGLIVPSGFQSYARLPHPARRFFGASAEQSVPLRWSEIAAARRKTRK